MALNPTEKHHTMTVRDHKIHNREPLHIPLELHRVTSYFSSRKSTKEEYENTPEDLCIKLTAESPDWDPASKQFQEQEDGILQGHRQLKDPVESWSPKCVVVALHSLPQ